MYGFQKRYSILTYKWCYSYTFYLIDSILMITCDILKNCCLDVCCYNRTKNDNYISYVWKDIESISTKLQKFRLSCTYNGYIQRNIYSYILKF